VAKARVLEIARKQIQDRLYKPPDLGALQVSVKTAIVILLPLGDAHRVLDDGTKVWLSDAERSSHGVQLAAVRELRSC
jgi:hypothetical protein